MSRPGLYKGAPIGIPFRTVRRSQPRARELRVRERSDGSRYPLPRSVAIEGERGSDSDRHVIVGGGHEPFAASVGGYPALMFGLTTVVAAAALAIVAMSFAFAGGAVILAVPLALLAVGLAFVVEVKRKRTQAQLIHRHREDAKTDKVDFTARDRQTLSTD